jgi:periplasmic mercuric ion binding protein
MKKLIFILIAMMGSHFVSAQTDSVKIMTSALCSECKERIEHDLSFEKGVKSSSVDLDSNVVTVIYNSKKTDPQKIRLAITKIGYDADTLKADLKAFNKLPECCRIPGMD